MTNLASFRAENASGNVGMWKQEKRKDVEKKKKKKGKKKKKEKEGRGKMGTRGEEEEEAVLGKSIWYIKVKIQSRGKNRGE